MKVVVAMMQHETNTFSPLPTPYAAFAGATGHDRPPAGDDAIAAYGGVDFPFAAFLDLAREAGAEVVVPIAANAEPSGPVADTAFETIAGRIADAVAAGCDAVMLDLHGAMVTESHDDGEGELLRRLRAVAPDVPIAVALDFHSHLTDAMVDNATVITGYRTYPHVDMYETGQRCATTLLDCLARDVRPHMRWGALPIISHCIRQSPAQHPMKDVMDMAVAAEADGSVLNASVFGGFPYADIPHVSLSAVVVSPDDDGDGNGSRLLDGLLALAWAHRDGFVYTPEPLEDAVAFAGSLDSGPVVLADHGDNSGAGGAADDMSAIREMLRQGLDDIAAGPIWDPDAVAALHAAGIGAEVTLEIGGKTDSPAIGLAGAPLSLTGRVANLTDGRFTIDGPMMTGFTVNLGPTAVLDTGALELVVSTRRCEPYDLCYLTHAGIDPARKKYLLLKSRLHFRAGFAPIARHIVPVTTAGVCSEAIAEFPFRRLRRPIYPLDPDTEWVH